MNENYKQQSGQDVPKLNPFHRKYFLSVNVPELLGDIALVVYSIFLSQYLSAEADIAHTLKPWQLLAMYSVVMLSLPYTSATSMRSIRHFTASSP